GNFNITHRINQLYKLKPLAIVLPQAYCLFKKNSYKKPPGNKFKMKPLGKNDSHKIYKKPFI
ncbi:MAG: hypothetical protein ACXW0H_09900, partial [Methylobacter sp.]